MEYVRYTLVHKLFREEQSERAHYSVTSSSTMSKGNVNSYLESFAVTEKSNLLTKSSKPNSVPVNSLSLFIITHIRDPIHLSISSENLIRGNIQGSRCHDVPSGKICEAIHVLESQATRVCGCDYVTIWYFFVAIALSAFPFLF